jgi:pyruvate/2-oxoacid:ferredoxin oxidoreductase beta subunit
MATVTAQKKLEAKDFKAEVPPDWCPGCGDFGVLNAFFKPAPSWRFSRTEAQVSRFGGRTTSWATRGAKLGISNETR